MSVPRLLKLSVDMLRREDSATSPGQEAADHIMHTKTSHCARCRKAGFMNGENPIDSAIGSIIAIIEHERNLSEMDRGMLERALRVCNKLQRRETIRKELRKDSEAIILKKPEGNDPAVHDVGEF